MVEMLDEELTEKEVWDILGQMKVSKAVELDEICCTIAKPLRNSWWNLSTSTLLHC